MTLASEDLIDQDTPQEGVDLGDENDQNDEGLPEQAEDDADASKPVENLSQQLDDNSNRSTGSKSKRRTSDCRRFRFYSVLREHRLAQEDAVARANVFER